jgi:hypothetical protein
MDASLPADLVALLGVPEGRRVSELERLRRPPTRTGASMAKALERVGEISASGVDTASERKPAISGCLASSGWCRRAR